MICSELGFRYKIAIIFLLMKIVILTLKIEYYKFIITKQLKT